MKDCILQGLADVCDLGSPAETTAALPLNTAHHAPLKIQTIRLYLYSSLPEATTGQRHQNSVGVGGKGAVEQATDSWSHVFSFLKDKNYPSQMKTQEQCRNFKEAQAAT